jgi:c(7)-type cytochrome triheme protein
MIGSVIMAILRRARGLHTRFASLALVCVGLGIGVAGLSWAQSTGTPWLPLRADSVHDPRGPGVRLLQEPAQALGEIAKIAPAAGGNNVRWVQAVEEKVIRPLPSIKDPSFVMKVLDLDIFLDIDGSMAVVRFPHRAHTLWLDCKNCHDEIFAEKVGVNKITMYEILQGNQCGICHGAVAFPLTECQRCHSVPQKEFEAMYRENRLPPNSAISIPEGKPVPGYFRK